MRFCLNRTHQIIYETRGSTGFEALCTVATFPTNTKKPLGLGGEGKVPMVAQQQSVAAKGGTL